MRKSKVALGGTLVLGLIATLVLNPTIALSLTQTSVFHATADAFVRETTPDRNYGSWRSLRTRGRPRDRSYVRFDVAAVGGAIVRARLLLWARRSSAAGIAVHSVADQSWEEPALTWRNAPRPGPTIATSGRIRGDRWVSIDVTTQVNQEGEIDFALSSFSRKRMLPFASSETNRGPRLRVETEPPQSPSPTVSPTSSPTNSNPSSSPTPTRSPSSSPSASSTPSSTPGTTPSPSPATSPSSTPPSPSPSPSPTQTPSPSASPTPGPTVVIAAAGDIACDPARSDFNAAPGTSTCQMGVTAGQVSALSPDGVLALGDNQYECGPLSAFNAGYANSWGAFKSITYPVPGNHEYGNTTLQQPFTPCDSPPQSGYFNYFGARAGDPSKGYYSFDLGAWHLVALNSECGSVGGCGPGSAQETWLTSDLASHPAACTLAFWHDPRFASGGPGNDAEMATFWSDLQAAGADVVLDGHFHVYERFAGQDSSGHATPLGLRQFTVGTGGRSLAAFGSVAANSEVRLNQSFGILKMTLRPTGYDWQFMPTTSSQGDAGSDTCH